MERPRITGNRVYQELMREARLSSVALADCRTAAEAEIQRLRFLGSLMALEPPVPPESLVAAMVALVDRVGKTRSFLWTEIASLCFPRTAV